MHCRSCKQFIRLRASKCNHCGASQNWRKYLEAPTFLLAFLASVVALFPVVNEAWKGDFVEVTVSIVKSDQRELLLLINNNGSIDAGVRRAFVDVSQNGTHLFKMYLETINWKLLKSKESHLIVAKALKGQVPIYVDPQYERNVSKGMCELTIEYVSFLSENHNITREYSCYLATFLPETIIN